MVDEIVLACDPALRRIEEILLWKNKLKTVLVFSFVHVVFWLLIIYNVRIYCLGASALLFLHLLDGYRTKKRRELNKLKNQPPKKIIESAQESFFSSCLNNTHVRKLSNWLHLDALTCPGAEPVVELESSHISSLGRYIIFVHAKAVTSLAKLQQLKEKNKIQYFLVMFLFWSMLAVIGIKIKGLYISYALFWLIFFLPPILHYDIPKRALQKCLPLLEQLDHSMKYERRSVLDKNELLVDVRLPKMGIDDDEQEDEYLKPFKFDEAIGRDVLEKLDDGEDDDEDTDEYVGGLAPDHEEEEIEEEFEYEVHQPRHRTEKHDKDEKNTTFEVRNVRKTTTKLTSRSKYGVDGDDDDEVDPSLLPNESLPNYMDITDNTEASFQFNYGSVEAVVKGDRVMRLRGNRNRPSLLEYYGESTNKSQKRQEHDIDETFDFLDEELKKY